MQKRRLQNRVSQQAVRRRRNSPARILETRLQELDQEHSSLMGLYTSNIESCIQTLTAEIQTLRELQGLLAMGTAVTLPPKFDAILASGLFPAGVNLGPDRSVWAAAGAGVGVVDQSAAYQNHDFDSSIRGAQLRIARLHDHVPLSLFNFCHREQQSSITRDNTPP